MMRLFLFLILAGFASAATVYGVVYDAHFEPAGNAVVEANSTPAQLMVAVNGSYSFNLPPGDYRIFAEWSNNTVSESLKVEEAGDFRVDLIFLPALPDDLSGAGEALEPEAVPTGDVQSLGASETLPLWLLAAVVLLVAALAGLVFFRLRRPAPTPSKPAAAPPFAKGASAPLPKQQPLSRDQKSLLKTLQSFNNRASQKELRKAMPQWSEAKASIELTELEDAGVIRKIKKGRGNIIRLN